MRILVTGAGGFVGHHLVHRLKMEDWWVRGVDIKRPQWSETEANEFLRLDLRLPTNAMVAAYKVDWVFHLAADMGGMGWITTQDAEIIKNNTLININMIEAARKHRVKRYLFSSSACIYPMYLQETETPIPLKEADAYPASPQHSYGWEKLHAEHLCRYYRESGWLETKFARFHNCYGDESEWRGGREKAPTALSRKVAAAKLSGRHQVEIWGDGKATRSYMHVHDCVEGLVRLMKSDFPGPLNIGRDRAISVDELVDIIARAAGIDVEKVYVPGPQGVRGRNSDNSLCREVLDWEPRIAVEEGIPPMYRWVEARVIEEMKCSGSIIGS